jgi:hypothetical protein
MTLSHFRDISNIIDIVLHWCKRFRDNDCKDGWYKLLKFYKGGKKGNIHSIIRLYATSFIVLEYESQTLFLNGV